MKIIIDLSDDFWQEVKISKNETVYKPRYSCDTVNWTNFSSFQNSGLPYVYKNNEDLCAYAGLVGQVPLFFNYSHDTLTLISSLKPQYRKRSSIDWIKAKEFIMFGYTLKNRTLIRGVKRLEAGQKLIVSTSSNEPEVKDSYVYNNTETRNNNMEALISDFFNISHEIFRELLYATKNKTILLPLSGGLDSRYLVGMLYKHGFRNVICYGWGSKGSSDLEISKFIANKLGYEWIEISHSQEIWQQIYTKDWFYDTLIDTMNYNSLSGIASFPFQNYLRGLSKEFLNQCVVIPGHSGGFISGGHIPLNLSRDANINTVARHILHKHKLNLSFKDKRVEDNLLQTLNNLSKVGEIEGYQLLERWDWRERQSKFIVSTNRYYESIGVQWNMPLWHQKFADYWSSIPYDYKIQQKLWRHALRSLFADIGLNFDEITEKSKKQKDSTRFRIKSKLQHQMECLNTVHFAYNTLSKFIKKRDEFGFTSYINPLYKSVKKKHYNGYKMYKKFISNNNIPFPIKPYDVLSRILLILILDNYHSKLED